MPTVSRGYDPELTPDRAMDVFTSHFAGKYDVYKALPLGIDFVVKKDAWTAIGVTVKQPNKLATTFVLRTPYMPTPIAMFLAVVSFGTIPYLLVSSRLDEMEGEIRRLIESQFK